MLRPWLDLVALQREWPGLAPQSLVNATCVAELSTSLAASPDARVVGAAVAAFGTDIVHVGLVGGVAVISIGVDELLRSKSVPLLKVQSTSIAKRLEGIGIAPPKWS